MKRLLLFLFSAIISLGLSAQDFESMPSWATSAPQKYIPANTTTVNSRTSACNKGTEPFIDFVTKFRTNKTFRKARTKLSEGDPYWGGHLESWSILKAGKGVDRKIRSKYYGTWYQISADNVCFKYEEESTDPNSDWGGSSLTLCFRRIDGKWYLIGGVVCG